MQERLDKYQLIRQLAIGSMGALYLARYEGIAGFEKLVAIKTIRPDLAGEPGFVDMFLEEARIVGLTRHPNVVAALDAGCSNGTYYLVFEYLQGWDIRRIVQRCMLGQHLVPVDLILRIALDVARGLAHIHELTGRDGQPLQVVHRDISPENLLITREGEAKVMDFGLVKQKLSLIHTAPGVRKGKAAYMSPEQAAGRTLGPASDQFSLALVLFELCTNTPRYKALGHELREMIELAALGSARSPRELRPDLPVELDEIIVKAMQRDPADRFPNTRYLALALEETRRATGLYTRRSQLVEYLHRIAPLRDP